MSQKPSEEEASKAEHRILTLPRVRKEATTQKLCDKCKRFFGGIDELPKPSDHCHHEEEKKGCEYCSKGDVIHFMFGNEIARGNFCPNCGRKL